MKKLIWFTTIAILLLIFVAPTILALGIKLVPGGDQPDYNSELRLSIYSIRDVSQQFISGDANLSAIGTSIRNPNLKNKDDVIFTLFDDKMNAIRKVVINGQNLEDGGFFKFLFDPISDSANKRYIFSISSPNAGPEDTIEVFYNPNMPSWIEQYSYDQEIHPGGIPIVLYFKPASRTTVIKDIYSNLFSKLLPLNFHRS